MISVIMGVYNGEKTVSRAVRSILDSEYTDFEFIIVDDGSTDTTPQILADLSATDNRIKIITNATNKGLAASLNVALDNAKGEYIARMDADDVSHPSRLGLSLEYVNTHDVDFVGTAARLIALDDKVWGNRFYPETIDKKILVKYNPFIHPTMLFNAVALRFVGGYRDTKRTVRCEDYDLVFRLYAAGFSGANIPKILFDYYENTDSFSRHTATTRFNEFCVRLKGSCKVHGGIRGFIYSFKPIILALLPKNTYNRLHNKRWQK